MTKKPGFTYHWDGKRRRTSPTVSRRLRPRGDGGSVYRVRSKGVSTQCHSVCPPWRVARPHPLVPSWHTRLLLPLDSVGRVPPSRVSPSPSPRDFPNSGRRLRMGNPENLSSGRTRYFYQGPGIFTGHIRFLEKPHLVSFSIREYDSLGETDFFPK